MTTKLNWLLLCFTAIFAFCFTSCKDDEEEYSADYLLAIAEEDMNISVDAETTSYEIELTARAIWKATVTAGNEDGWLTLENDGDTGGVNTLSFSMEENTTGATRTATITITCHTAQKEITVTQSGSDLMIMDESEIEDFEKYYKPAEFASMDMLRSDAQWSWFRSKQSEHFFVFWEAGFGDDPNAETVPANMRVDIDDLLEKAEQFYATNIERLKFAEIGQGKSYLDEYKMEIYLLYQEEWLATGSGYDDVIGALWVNPSTCQPVGSTIAHEIGHSFQYQVYCDKVYQGEANDFQTGFRYGYEGSNGGNGFWEQCAQWQSFQDYPEEMFTTYNFDVWLANNHRHFEHEWMRYASYWLQTYWTDKHGDDAVANVWKNSHAPEDAIAAYMRLYANNSWETMKEELYDYAARMATFDINGIREYSDGYLGRYSTTLYPTADGYYQVAYADCPETTGFNVIALNVPEGQTTVSADFEGLMPGSPLAADDPGEYMDTEVVAGTVDTYNNIGDASDAGWSYGFVALTSGGTRVYSERYAAEAGNASFTVPAGTEQLYFIVQAAPKTYKAHPWDEKDLTDEQWPYKVKFNGTDLLGSVVIDPDAQPTDVTFTYDLSFPATTNGDYTGTTVSVINEGDMEELAQAFVMQPSLIASKIMEANATPAEGQIAFAAVQADGSLEYNCTANGLGFWYDKAGNAIGWGDDSYVYSEFNKDTFTFTIGQFPDHCTAGDTYTIREALVYTLNGTQYTATFVFNIRIL